LRGFFAIFGLGGFPDSENMACTIHSPIQAKLGSTPLARQKRLRTETSSKSFVVFHKLPTKLAKLLRYTKLANCKEMTEITRNTRLHMRHEITKIT